MRRAALITAVTAAFALALVQIAGASTIEELSPAAQSLAQCVQTNHRLSVLMLIDESGSLRTTDPQGERVDGIRAAITGLADLAETPVGGTKPEVSVLLAGFHSKVHPDPRKEPVGPGAWKPVDRDTVDVLNGAAGDYARLNQGRGTDYGTALLAARQLLKERLIEQSESGAAPPCEALIWFTDGRYALPRRVGKAGIGLPKTVPYAPGIRLDQPGAGERAVSAGRTLMCKPGGIMDSLSASGVIRFTVALSTQLSPQDAAFLDAATTGTAGVQRCGSELSSRSGEYLDASNGDRLFFVFGDLLSASASVHTNDVCPAFACVRGITSFRTVPGLSQFLIRASSGIEGAELELKGPDGKSVRLTPESPEHLSLSGASVTDRWVSPTAVEVQGEFSPADSAWIGGWSYSFLDPSATSSQAASPKSRSSVQLFADLEPAMLGDPTLIRGSPTRLELVLQGSSAAGEPLHSGPLLDSASLTATVDDPVAGTSTPVRIVGPDKAGRFSTSIAIPKDSSAGFVYLGVTAHLAIPGGTPVAPQYRSYSLPVRFPPGQGFPTISPESLSPPSVRGLSSTEAELTLTGSSVAAGCAWLGTPELDAPGGEQVSGVFEPAARSAGDCVKVPRGEERVLRIRFEPASAATGDISGSLPVHLSSDIVDGSRTVSVPVTFVVTAKADITHRDILFALLIVFGVLFPILFLHLLNYLNARLTAPQDLLVLVQGAEASSQGLTTSIEPHYEAFKPLSLTGENRRVRTLEADPVHFRAIASGGLTGLFRGPYGVASAEGGGPIAAGALDVPLRSWDGGARHEVPLSLAGTWIFVPDRDPDIGAEDAVAESSELWDPPGGADRTSEDPAQRQTGQLILLIANGGDPEMGGQLLADASRALGDDELRRHLVPRAQDEEPEDGEGSRLCRIFRRRRGSESEAIPEEETGQLVGESAQENDPWE